MLTTFSSLLLIYLLREAEGYFCLQNMEGEERFEAWQSSFPGVRETWEAHRETHARVPEPSVRFRTRSPSSVCHTNPCSPAGSTWPMLGFSCCVASPHVGRRLGEGLARRLPRGSLATCRTSHLALQPRLEPATSALSCSPHPPAATRAWQGLGATSTTGPTTSPWRMGAGMGNAPSQAFGIASSSPQLLLVLITTASCTSYCFLQFCLIMAWLTLFQTSTDSQHHASLV